MLKIPLNTYSCSAFRCTHSIADCLLALCTGTMLKIPLNTYSCSAFRCTHSIADCLLALCTGTMLKIPLNTCHMLQVCKELRNRLQSASSTQASTYRDINSDLSVHPMYQPNHYICELHRIATTRLWLSSYRLRIETDQWSRIPRQERMC